MVLAHLASAFTHGDHQERSRSQRLPERWLGRAHKTSTEAQPRFRGEITYD
jgi:hypothetical protein